jgi:ParB family chromosome partitioning protein
MLQTVKLAKLILSDINVRTAGHDLIEQLAANILARGILQNLIVTAVKKPRGAFAVIAGSRRYRALMLLAERGEIVAADYDVPVLMLTGDNGALSEASLAENFHHLAMSPTDECRAFQHCLSQSDDIDAVAKRFGITRRFVEGRLRLASLAEPIFEALASGEMTLDMAKAYASTESHERQMMVWNSYGKSAYNGADTIRRVIANESMKSTDPVARLVGHDAYVAAGGIIDRDLFSDAGDRWSNPEIAQSLAGALMEAEAKRIGDEKGLAWIRPIASASSWEAARGLHRVNLPEIPISDEEEARLVVMEARLEVLGAEMENEDLDEAVFAALDTEYDTLNEEANQIRHYRPKILPPELAPRIGMFLTLSQTGEMELDDDYYSETPLRVTMVEPEESDTGGEGDAQIGEHIDAATGETIAPTFPIEEGAGNTNGGTGITGGTAAVDPDRAAPGGKALSQVLLDQLSVQRRDVLGAAIIANPALALDYMLFVMVDARTGDGSHSGTTIRSSYPQDPMLANNVPDTRARDYLAEVREGLDSRWTSSNDKVARFEAFRILDDETKSAWLAWVVASSFEAKDSYTVHQNPLQNRLATILEVDVASWWRPTSENFFDRVSKGTLLSLLDEVGGPALSGRHASQKKTEISASCEKLFAGEAVIEADIKEAALAWVPSAMRFNNVETIAAVDEGEPEAEGDDDLASLIGEDTAGPDDGDVGEAGPIDDDLGLGDAEAGALTDDESYDNENDLNHEVIAAE